jgi:UDP-glucose 4-epimerase
METITDKRVLVTGGTGSFGLFIVQRLLKLGAGEVRILSRDEKKHYDMRRHFAGEPRLNLLTGDIRDKERVRQAMSGCDIVFQAAALKHVSNCELHPYEAIHTNVIGVQNVVNAALECEVSRFITISTDKAVKPVNVMGMTKALQERLVIAANQLPNNSGTKLCCVRYGNVMSSRGSAIPFFRDLVARGEAITVTHESMTRFLLTLDDAIDLVMLAAECMRGGEIYVKKAPAVRIMDLARCIAEAEGGTFRHRTIGMIPGEKLHEILISEEELGRTQNLADYFVVQPFWSGARFAEVTDEYVSSRNLVTSKKTINDLLARSDEELATYGLTNSVFLK